MTTIDPLRAPGTDDEPMRSLGVTFEVSVPNRDVSARVADGWTPAAARRRSGLIAGWCVVGLALLVLLAVAAKAVAG